MLRNPCKKCMLIINCSEECLEIKYRKYSIQKVKNGIENTFIFIYFLMMFLLILIAFVLKWRS